MTKLRWDEVPDAVFAPQGPNEAPEGGDPFLSSDRPEGPPKAAQMVLDWRALGLSAEDIARITSMDIAGVCAVAEQYPVDWEYATVDAYHRMLGLVYQFALGRERANSGQLSYLHDMLGYLGGMIGISDTESIVRGAEGDDTSNDE